MSIKCITWSVLFKLNVKRLYLVDKSPSHLSSRPSKYHFSDYPDSYANEVVTRESKSDTLAA
ncbi:hypothetical protein EAH57_08090 [Acinetobacter sp. 2JN-4]|nr:hypothetical protein EAH57_08090 [Acinetobacter sp. 2JN-4]